MWTLGSGVITHLAAIGTASRTSGMMVFHISGMAMLAMVLLLGGLTYVRRGMSPLEQLRARLKALPAGEQTRLEGKYPAEVQPLVSDLNELLDDRDSRIARARAKAGDLAHGLKTPLAVLSQEADHDFHCNGIEVRCFTPHLPSFPHAGVGFERPVNAIEFAGQQLIVVAELKQL
jgi:signal transduction histidine kinase